MTSLHEYLDQKEGVNDESFKIEDEVQVNWALRKIKQLQDEKEKNVSLANAEIEKIEEWLNSMNDQVQQSIDYFQSLLAEYALKQRKNDPEFKSLKLPNGRIGFRKQQPKWEYDNTKLVESLKASERTDLIRIKEEPDKSAIKKAFQVVDDKVVDTETGQVIEGITVEQREDAFRVEVSE